MTVVQSCVKTPLAVAPRSAIDSYAADDGLCHAHQRESASGSNKKAHSEDAGQHLVRRGGGSNDFPDCSDGSDRSRRKPPNRKHLVGVRDTGRPRPGGIGFRGLRMVRRQPFHSAQRRRRLPNLAISRGGHFALVVALRHRRLVNPDSAFRFPSWLSSSSQNTVLAVIDARGFKSLRATAARRKQASLIKTSENCAIALSRWRSIPERRPSHIPAKPASCSRRASRRRAP